MAALAAGAPRKGSRGRVWGRRPCRLSGRVGVPSAPGRRALTPWPGPAAVSAGDTRSRRRARAAAAPCERGQGSVGAARALRRAGGFYRDAAPDSPASCLRKLAGALSHSGKQVGTFCPPMPCSAGDPSRKVRMVPLSCLLRRRRALASAQFSGGGGCGRRIAPSGAAPEAVSPPLAQGEAKGLRGGTAVGPGLAIQLGVQLPETGTRLGGSASPGSEVAAAMVGRCRL